MVSKSEEGATPAAGAGAIAGARGTATPRLEDITPKKSPGYTARAWRRFRRNKLSLVALCIFALITLISFSAPLVSKFITKQIRVAEPDDEALQAGEHGADNQNRRPAERPARDPEALARLG